MNPIKLIVGLGNPGNQYQKTRHNAGFWFIEELARQYHVDLKTEKRFQSVAGKLTTSHGDAWLLMPQTFMNLSGSAVQSIAKFYQIPIESILVVHDELDLSCDTVKLKQGGGHAGHNGLRDIINKCGGNNFWRLRIGIDHPRNHHNQEVADYVLHAPSLDDRISIDRAIDKAIDCLPLLLKGQFDKAMQQLHTA